MELTGLLPYVSFIFMVIKHWCMKLAEKSREQMSMSCRKYYKNLEIPFECAVQDNILPLDEYDFIIDAMFGIGLSRDVTGVYAQIIDEINRVSAVKVAVDIPSGLSAGIVQVSNKKVKADYTVTFGFDKTGMVLYPGRKYAGKVIVSDIGFAVSQDNVQKY